MTAAVLAAEVAERTTIGFYLIYAALALGLVFYLARTLQVNGAVFLRDVFEDASLAGSVNHLLVVGFYLLNLGYAILLFRLESDYASLTEAFNELTVKIGLLLASLGVIHLLNMFIFWRIRNHRHSGVRRPPANPLPSNRMPPPAPLTPNPAAPANPIGANPANPMGANPMQPGPVAPA